jgi:hypothetical protein
MSLAELYTRAVGVLISELEQSIAETKDTTRAARRVSLSESDTIEMMARMVPEWEDRIAELRRISARVLRDDDTVEMEEFLCGARDTGAPGFAFLAGWEPQD